MFPEGQIYYRRGGAMICSREGREVRDAIIHADGSGEGETLDREEIC